MKNHTCSCHIGSDGKSKCKAHKFGFLEKVSDCPQVFVSRLLELGQLVLWIWVERESCFWKVTGVSKLEKKLSCFCWTLWYQFLDLWKITPLSLMYHTYEKFLKLIEIGSSTLNSLLYTHVDNCIVRAMCWVQPSGSATTLRYMALFGRIRYGFTYLACAICKVHYIKSHNGHWGAKNYKRSKERFPLSAQSNDRGEPVEFEK